MFSRTFEYKGFDGEMHKETRWFNLSDAEIAELNLSTIGGINEMINRLLREQKPGEIVKMFKALILKSVGERSMDGRRFIKKEIPGMEWGEIAQDFKETPAYDQLFVELVSSGKKVREFLLGCISDEARAAITAGDTNAPAAAPSDNILPFVQPEVESGKPDAP